LFRFGKKVEEELFEIYYEALSKDTPEFGEIPRKYHAIIQQTLQDDLLVQANREKDLPPLTAIGKLSVIAYQKAQNKVKADDYAKRQREINNP